MVRLMQIFMMAMLLLIPPFVHAHEGHDHMPVSMKKAVEIALATTQGYTNKIPPFGLPPLDKSWSNLPASAAQIYENGRGYYLVSVANATQAKTLYLRVLLDGRVDAANFSGDFSASSAARSAK